jgi:putative endonuclease
MVGHMEYCLYILQSEKDKGFYVGISADVEKRLEAHNRGGTPSTKYRRPFRLIHVERYSTRVEARAREIFLKSYAGSREKKEILENCRIV